MHDWHTVAAIILTVDRAITENLTGSPGAAVRMDPMFIGPVIVVTKNTVLFQMIAQEEMIFIPRHPIVHQIFVHLAVDPPAIVEIEGKKSRGVQYFRSEEHTSELQSLMRNSYAVFCLKKK